MPETPQPIPSAELGETIGDKSHVLLSQRIKNVCDGLAEHTRIDEKLEVLMEQRMNSFDRRLTMQKEAFGMHGLKHDIRERSKEPSKLTRFHRAARSRIRFLVTGR